ncbi:MAG: helix-turn-helix domain-containing protein [Oscillospiraceae bacterium]|jgi:transcriptional regulator with XRE-family HTH domain|nr:helix-turn-helix domain-containing protein [Oscillospiraceae bacterium]
MNAAAIGKNVKKLRDKRGITQQQLADALGVSYQAVSKWETATTLPDTATLPAIATYFGVSIDELFTAALTPYRNRAERLLGDYEADANDDAAFERANAEFKRLLAGDFTHEDLSAFAYLNDMRHRHYLDVAEQAYLDAIAKGEDARDDEYYKTHRQYTLFLSRLGRVTEAVERYTELLRAEPKSPQNYSLLICALMCAPDWEKAYAAAVEGVELFPNDAMLLCLLGDICKQLGRFDDAVRYWDMSWELDSSWIDTRYSKAFFLAERGLRAEAVAVWDGIIAWMSARGYEDNELEWQREMRDKLLLQE